MNWKKIKIEFIVAFIWNTGSFSYSGCLELWISLGFFTYSTLYVWDPDHILLLWTNDDVFETQSFYFINQFIITFWHEGTESVNPLRPRSTPSGSQGLFCWSKSCLSILMRLKTCKFGMYFKCWTTCRFVVEVIITFNILKIVWDQKPRPRPKLETQI